ncbi:MAG: YdbC family protein [Cetobacterium sp.]|uniref:YdbC family protein n=1 Tax=Cetobacterium sp. TaxID=2071632 RepID=UPI003F3421B8
MAEIKFEIIENLGILGEGSKGWSKELNLISWNSRKPKLDIRDWDEEHEKMGKGITLSKEEVKNLKELLNSIDLDKLDM